MHLSPLDTIPAEAPFLTQSFRYSKVMEAFVMYNFMRRGKRYIVAKTKRNSLDNVHAK